MPPAVIAGGIAAVGAIGGAVIGSKSQSKATEAANDAQQQAAAQQYALGQQSLQLNTDIYDSNYNLLSPYVSRGNVAGDAYNSLLGLPSAPKMTSPVAPQTTAAKAVAAGTPGATSVAPYTQAQIDAMWHDGIDGNAEAAQAVLTQWNASHPPTPAPAPTNALLHPPTPPVAAPAAAPAPNSAVLQQQAQAAIAAGADPAAVNARLSSMTGAH